MRKLSEVRELLKFNETQVNAIAETLEELKEPFNSDIPLQICFGYQRPSGFDIQLAEIVVIPQLQKEHLDFYKKARKYYLKVKQAELEICLLNIKRLKIEEREIIDSFLKYEEEGYSEKNTCSHQPPCNLH